MPAEKCPFEIFVSTKKWASLKNCMAPGPLTLTIGGSEVVDTARTRTTYRAVFNPLFMYISNHLGVRQRADLMLGSSRKGFLKNCYCCLRQFHYVPLADL